MEPSFGKIFFKNPEAKIAHLFTFFFSKKMIFNEFVVAIDVDEILQQVERCSL
jgi:hypothetical protein